MTEEEEIDLGPFEDFLKELNEFRGDSFKPGEKPVVSLVNYDDKTECFLKYFKKSQDKTVKKGFVRELIFQYCCKNIGLPVLPLFGFQFFSRQDEGFIATQTTGRGTLLDAINEAFKKKTSTSKQTESNAFKDVQEDDITSNILPTRQFIELNATKNMKIIYGIAFILSKIHDHKIIFRNLSPKNISLNEEGEPYLGGSDFSRRIETEENTTSGSKGCPPYMSPEQMSNKNVTLKVDIYGLAAVICHMLAGKITVNQVNIENLTRDEIIVRYNKELTIDIPDDLNNDFKAFLQACLSFKPEDRPTAQAIVDKIESRELLLDNCDETELQTYINKIKSEYARQSQNFDFNCQWNDNFRLLTNAIGCDCDNPLGE